MARGILAVLIAAATFAAVGAAPAAAAPTLMIESPENGSSTSDTTPTIAGTSSDMVDQVTVAVHEGSSDAGPLAQSPSATPSLDGSWSVTPATLSDGTYTAVAEQTELLGLGGPGSSAPVTFTVDTVPPVVTLAPIASPTNDSTPTLEGLAGTAEGDRSAVTITIYAGSSVGGGVAAEGNAILSGGAWSYTSPRLADGTYTAQATQSDAAGNTGASKARTFTVKTTAPAVTLKPVPTPSNDSTPTLEGGAGTAAGDDPEVTIDIYEGGSVGGTAVASGSAAASGGKWTYTAPHLADGTYTAQASQQDSTGNTGKSAPQTFTIDTVAPSVTLNPIDSPTSDSTPTLAGEAGTASGDEHAVMVTVYDGTSVGGTVASSGAATIGGSSWTYTAKKLKDGTYTAQATQKDAAGNTGESQAHTFTVKTHAPEVTLEPVPTPSSNATPTLAGSAGTAGGDKPEITVDIYVGKSVGGAPAASGSVTASGGRWSYTSPHLADGTYTAQASQNDAAGNTGTSAPQTFTIDTVAPAVTLNAIASPTNDPTPTLAGELGSAEGDDHSVTVTVYAGTSVGGAVASSGSAAIGGRSWTYTATKLPDGTYTAQATQSDTAGNVGKSQARTFVVKTAAPAVTLKPLPSLSNNATPTLEGTAGTADGDEPEVTVKIYAGESVAGTPAVSGSATASGGAWSFTSPRLTDGTYTAQASQRDSTGNTGKSAPQTFTIDTVAPAVTMKAITSPTKDATPTLEGEVGAAKGDEQAVTVTVYEGTSVGGVVASSGSAAISGVSWTYTTKELRDGTYTAQATQNDVAGNKGLSSPRTFTVKTAKPVVTLNPPQALSNNATPVFSGNADTRPGDIQSVTLRVYAGSEPSGSALRTLTVSASEGKWEAGPVARLPDGTYTAQAEQSDQAGNVGLSAPATFSIRTTPPAISMSAPPSPTNDPTPTLKGTRGTASGDKPTVSVAVYEGGTVGGTPVASSTFGVSGSAWSYTTPHLADGTYTALAEQEDEFGNVGESTVTFTIDTAPPVLTLNPVASPSKNSTPKLSGSAGNAPGDSPTVHVTIYEGSSTGGKVASSGAATRSGGTWSYESPHLGDGTYTAQATQTDEAGNVGTSGAQTFTINTAAPTVTMSSPAPLSNNTTPSFSGTASDTTPVTVSIYSGTATTGTPVRKAIAPVSSGSWSSEPISPPLPDGQYTAIATQPSSLGNPEGRSAPATFTVSTAAPTVTLAQPTSPSNNLTPSFTGTASDITPVTVKVYEGERSTGTPVAEAVATHLGEAWTSSAAKPALQTGKHTYTAVASQTSSLGNHEGTSVPVTFVVDTTAPMVTLSAPANPRSNNPTPSFAGTASDTSSVTVDIYKGKVVGGTPVGTATAVPVGGAWTSTPTAPRLADGEYTAQATQQSSIGNAAGVSGPVTFVIDTTPPAVTINPVPAKTNKAGAELSGNVGTEAGDESTVVVKIYKGSVVGGEIVAEQKMQIASQVTAWSFKSSNLADGTYTAQATQADQAGNNGASAAVTFTIDTVPPTVTVNAPASPSNNQQPAFTGTSSDSTTVTVKIYTGAKPEGTPVATVTASGGPEWKSAPIAKPLPSHTYTAVAAQIDEAGNEGTSQAVHFIVDTEAPTVTLDRPRSPSNDATPSFTGSASETREPVIVSVHEGAVTGPVVATAEAPGTGGRWTSSQASPALRDGTYTAVAVQESLAKNHSGASEPVTFTIDTVEPVVKLSEPANGTSTSGESQVVAGSTEGDADDGSTVTVQLFSGASIGEGQAPVRSVIVNAAAGRWSYTFAGLAAGAYTARAEQSDDAGNTGVSGASTFYLTQSAAGSPAGRPAASFSWYPPAPHVGEPVSLASNSSDSTSPLTAFAWDLAGTGSFQPGGPVMSTSFAVAGSHVVRLRATDASGAISVATETIPVSSRPAQLLRPFPLVRIVTSRTGSRIRLRLLSILASPGTRITITCKGHSCPISKQSKVAAAGKVGLASVSFGRFQRTFATGTILEIRVSQVGQIGKYTSLSIRRGGVLKRVDACLPPNGSKPMPCPSS